MRKPNRKVLFTLLAAVALFAACKKRPTIEQPGGVDPIPETPTYPEIIVNSNNQILYAINPSTGGKIWELGLPNPMTTPLVTFAPSPMLYKGRLYVASGNPNNDTLYKINPRTGEIVKKIDVVSGGGTTTFESTPVADGALIYIAGYNGIVYAIDTGSYAVKWSFTASGPIVSSPVVYNDQVYFATTNGTLYAVKKGDGTINPSDTPNVWSITVPNASFYSSPAISAPYLYVGSTTDSNMYAFYLKSPVNVGTVRWTYKTKGAIYSSPAALSGMCIFGSNDFRLYCLDTALQPGYTSPGSRWDSARGIFSSEIYSSPYVSGQTIYVGCKDYKTYAINIVDGSTRWSHQANGVIKASPICYHGIVYIGSYDKTLYALDSAKGTLKWTYAINGQMLASPVIDENNGRYFHSGISGFSNYGAK